MSKLLLMSTLDEFCEPASLYQLAEKYKLEADFYVNPEMVSFNKKATVSDIFTFFMHIKAMKD
jgi:hypothetical protein